LIRDTVDEVSPPHPALRADLSPQAGRGKKSSAAGTTL